MTPEGAAGSAGLPRILRDHIRQALAPLAGAPVGVAVSGGGDSMALLHLAAQVVPPGRLAAVTVDHGLRQESAAEAAQVAAFCAARGIAHDTLRWDGRRAQGNLQEAARDARYRMMAGWAQGRGLGAVLVGHTADDAAETFLMRLAREAGLDGLSGMARDFHRDGMRWLRPLLGAGRADLRALLREADIRWSDDPSNDDRRFQRVRARAALAALGPVGIDAAGLGRVMAQLGEARHALRAAVHALAQRAVTQDRGDLLFDWPLIAEQHHELQRRCLVAALTWVASAPYPPRREDVAEIGLALAQDGQRTLHGCVLRRHGPVLRVSREPQAVRALRGPTDAVWDGRWRLDGPHGGGCELRALGAAGLRGCPDWRTTGLPRLSLLASPAVWAGDRLVAAPLAGLDAGWTARIVADFHETLLSH